MKHFMFTRIMQPSNLYCSKNALKVKFLLTIFSSKLSKKKHGYFHVSIDYLALWDLISGFLRNLVRLHLFYMLNPLHPLLLLAFYLKPLLFESKEQQDCGACNPRLRPVTFGTSLNPAMFKP